MSLKFKQSEHDLLQQIQFNVTNKIRNDLQNMHIWGYSSIDDIKSAIAMHVGIAVSEGFSTLLENIYTNQDFERDIGLRD